MEDLALENPHYGRLVEDSNELFYNTTYYQSNSGNHERKNIFSTQKIVVPLYQNEEISLLHPFKSKHDGKLSSFLKDSKDKKPVTRKSGLSITDKKGIDTPNFVMSPVATQQKKTIIHQLEECRAHFEIQDGPITEVFKSEKNDIELSFSNKTNDKSKLKISSKSNFDVDKSFNYRNSSNNYSLSITPDSYSALTNKSQKGLTKIISLEKESQALNMSSSANSLNSIEENNNHQSLVLKMKNFTNNINSKLEESEIHSSKRKNEERLKAIADKFKIINNIRGKSIDTTGIVQHQEVNSNLNDIQKNLMVKDKNLISKQQTGHLRSASTMFNAMSPQLDFSKSLKSPFNKINILENLFTPTENNDSSTIFHQRHINTEDIKMNRATNSVTLQKNETVKIFRQLFLDHVSFGNSFEKTIKNVMKRLKMNAFNYFKDLLIHPQSKMKQIQPAFTSFSNLEIAPKNSFGKCEPKSAPDFSPLSNSNHVKIIHPPHLFNRNPNIPIETYFDLLDRLVQIMMKKFEQQRRFAYLKLRITPRNKILSLNSPDIDSILSNLPKIEISHIDDKSGDDKFILQKEIQKDAYSYYSKDSGTISYNSSSLASPPCSNITSRLGNSKTMSFQNEYLSHRISKLAQISEMVSKNEISQLSGGESIPNYQNHHSSATSLSYLNPNIPGLYKPVGLISSSCIPCTPKGMNNSLTTSHSSNYLGSPMQLNKSIYHNQPGLTIVPKLLNAASPNYQSSHVRSCSTLAPYINTHLSTGFPGPINQTSNLPILFDTKSSQTSDFCNLISPTNKKRAVSLSKFSPSKKVIEGVFQTLNQKFTRNLNFFCILDKIISRKIKDKLYIILQLFKRLSKSVPSSPKMISNQLDHFTSQPIKNSSPTSKINLVKSEEYENYVISPRSRDSYGNLSNSPTNGLNMGYKIEKFFKKAYISNLFFSFKKISDFANQEVIPVYMTKYSPKFKGTHSNSHRDLTEVMYSLNSPRISQKSESTKINSLFMPQATNEMYFSGEKIYTQSHIALKAPVTSNSVGTSTLKMSLTKIQINYQRKQDKLNVVLKIVNSKLLMLYMIFIVNLKKISSLRITEKTLQRHIKFIYFANSVNTKILRKAFKNIQNSGINNMRIRNSIVLVINLIL